ncbi:MAG TPA: YniB family protein [Cellvibrio sp.]|nr:YniB family protein [Cellvibrio sp.]
MPYQQAQYKFYSRLSLGTFLFFIASLSTFSSLLKMFYLSSHVNTPTANALMYFLRNTVKPNYQSTQYFSYFWSHLPLPNLEVLWAKQNFYFLTSYIAIFISLAYVSSALTLRKKLLAANKKVEYALIIDSAIGRKIRSRQEILKAIPIPTPKLQAQLRMLYLAPVLVAALIILFSKCAGLI